jgi:hypothetical protein
MNDKPIVTIYRWTRTSWAWKTSIPTYYYVRAESAEQANAFETLAEAMAYAQGERNTYQRLGYEVIVIDAAPPGEE